MESQAFVYVLAMAREPFEDNGIYKTYRLAQFCQGLLKTFKERKEEEKRKEKRKEKNSDHTNGIITWEASLGSVLQEVTEMEGGRSVVKDFSERGKMFI